MDFLDEMLNDQPLPFTPSWFPPSPEPFPQLMEFMQDPMMVEPDNVDVEFGELFSIPAISEANPSTSTQPSLTPYPESLTIQQNPPDMQKDQQLLCSSHGYLQHSDQQDLFNPNMLNSFQEPDVSTMQQQQQLPLSSSHGSLQQFDQQGLLNPNMLNSFQEPGVSAMQQQQLLCDSHGNLPNIHSNQQYLLTQNMMNSFQEPNDSTMMNIGNQIEEGNSGYAHDQPLIDSFELPNHLQEQLLSVATSHSYQSYPAYQHGAIGSHFNMYDQQPPPRVLTNKDDEHLAPRIVTDLARTYPLQNQSSTTLFRPQMPSSSTRTYSLQNQISMIPPQSQMPSSSTRTPQQNQISMPPPQSQMPSSSTRACRLQPNQNLMTSSQLQMPSSSTRHHGNVHELVIQPLPSFRCPQLDTSTQIRPCTNSLTTPVQSSVLGRRQRSYQNHFELGESSSAQRRRIALPKRNIDSNAANLGEERLQNGLYNPLYEGLGLAIDPILRKFHFQT